MNPIERIDALEQRVTLLESKARPEKAAYAKTDSYPPRFTPEAAAAALRHR